MNEEGRPLHVRVKNLADTYDAMANGAEKKAEASKQLAGNYRRTAAMLHEAAAVCKAAKP